MKRTLILFFAVLFFPHCIAGRSHAINLPGGGSRAREAREEKLFSHRQKSALKNAEESFLRGDYDGAAKICEDMLYLSRRRRPGKRHMDEMRYLAGISYLKLKNTEKARAHLRRILDEYRHGGFFTEASLALAEAHFLDEEHDESAKLLLNYIRAHPKGDSVPQAYLRLGQIAQSRGRWEEAKYYFEKIKQEFPLSFEAKLAPGAGDPEEFFFSVQLGYFKELKNAEKLKEKLEKKGHSPYILEVKSGDSVFYRLRVGKLKSRAEAKQLSDKLKKEGFQTKICP